MFIYTSFGTITKKYSEIHALLGLRAASFLALKPQKYGSRSPLRRRRRMHREKEKDAGGIERRSLYIALLELIEKIISKNMIKKQMVILLKSFTLHLVI